MNSKDNDTEPYIQLKKIYDSLANKNFSIHPNYSNGLTKENSKISNNNLILIEKLSKITRFFLISPLDIIYKEQYDKFKNITKETEKCPICL